ncbi:MAG: NAD(P)-dependent alcohol dehydrogenase [Anaerolineae bacterium]|nr:NAD(P)-dependent alcohol dehydrogenase [Anaerolineae bacterium]
MKAIVCTKYGPPEVLRLQDVRKPSPRANEVLIKIRATAVTASDCIIRGFKLKRLSPMGFMMGLVIGFRGPRKPILGMVLAGDVEAVGADVTRFKPGDAVYGSTFRPNQIRFGAYAEYLCMADDSLIAAKPANVSYEESAAIPYGINLALHFLRQGEIQGGQKVLIYGASGSIGTAAVQLAKYHFGADVTGVCSTANIDLVKSLGADHVIDYTDEDATSHLERYDFILDAVGRRKSSALKTQSEQALTPNGKIISVDDGTPKDRLENLLLLKEMVEAGQFKPVIDCAYPLEQMVEAHRHVETGHKKGNVVITVA